MVCGVVTLITSDINEHSPVYSTVCTFSMYNNKLVHDITTFKGPTSTFNEALHSYFKKYS